MNEKVLPIRFLDYNGKNFLTIIDNKVWKNNDRMFIPIFGGLSKDQVGIAKCWYDSGEGILKATCTPSPNIPIDWDSREFLLPQFQIKLSDIDTHNAGGGKSFLIIQDAVIVSVRI